MMGSDMERKDATTAAQRAQAYGLLAALMLDEPSREIAAALDAQSSYEDVRVDYARLFANAGADSVHPYESVYLSPDKLLMQDERDAVLAAYLAESYAVDESLHLPEDHAAFELAFMACLCEREDQAQADEASRLSGVQAAFLREHVLRWIPQLCADIEARAQTGLYREVARLCREFLSEEARTLGIEGDAA